MVSVIPRYNFWGRGSLTMELIHITYFQKSDLSSLFLLRIRRFRVSCRITLYHHPFLEGDTTKCQQHLETVKKQSIDFLKQCESENKKLVEKVPAVANSKYSKKGIIIYCLAGVRIISLFIQLLL